MKDRLKILDCNRKAVLGLPDAAFKLWHCYYMNEDDEQESWLSIPEIMAQTGKSRRSIIDWTKWLVANHWLIDTGKTAADKWMAMGKRSTIGSHQIHVYRVDDPVSSKVPVQNEHQYKIGTSANGAPKVSGSNSSLPQTKPKVQTDGVKKIKTTNPVGGVSANQVKTLRKKDGSMVPKPEGFDSWSNADRLNWLNGLPTQKEQDEELDLALMSRETISEEAFASRLNAAPLTPEEAAEKVRQMKEADEKRAAMRYNSPLRKMLEQA